MPRMTPRTKPSLVVGGHYLISYGGSGYSHLGGSFCEAINERTLKVIRGTYLGYTVPASDVNYRRVHQHKVCRCRAYKWPHRLGGGSCLGNESPPFCANCGQPCKATANVYYERILSNCCNSPLYNNAELTELYQPTDYYQDVRKPE